MPSGPPRWLRLWRRILTRLDMYFNMVMSAHYLLVTTGFRANLRDQLIARFFTTPTPLTCFTTPVVNEIQHRSSQRQYAVDPTTCSHELPLRPYSARALTSVRNATGSYHICDLCGSRWVKLANATWQSIEARSAPTPSPPPKGGGRGGGATEVAADQGRSSTERRRPEHHDISDAGAPRPRPGVRRAPVTWRGGSDRDSHEELGSEPPPRHSWQPSGPASSARQRPPARGHRPPRQVPENYNPENDADWDLTGSQTEETETSPQGQPGTEPLTASDESMQQHSPD